MHGPDNFKPVQFGRFLLTERLAVGGMAEIFTAKLLGAMGFEKRLVVKRILPDYAADRSFVRMLAIEAKLVCNLEHPNIVQVYELGEVDERYYIAMEYVDGIDARTLWRALALQDLRLPVPLALYVVSEFLKGLDFAHHAIGPHGQALGVVHRDVSPSNIMISFRGAVKIGDFGIALVQQESKSRVSSVKGKYGYLTPEQLSGGTVDHRSDIFAAGVVMAELLTGRRLFKGKNDYETMRRVLNLDLHVLEEYEADLPGDVNRTVHRALMRDVEARYDTALAFQEDVAACLHGIAPRVGGKSLAAFIAEHVVPRLAHATPGQDDVITASGAMEPDTVSRSLSPSGELTPSGGFDDDDPTVPGGPIDQEEFVETYGETFDTFADEEPTQSNQIVDWSRLAPELAHVDGTVEAPPSAGGGLTGHVRSQLEQDLDVLAREDPDAGDTQHHGEVEFDFSDEAIAPLKTHDEVLREMEAGLNAPRKRPEPEPAKPDLEGLTVSVALEEADALGGDRAPTELSGTLATHSVTRVLFRICSAGESGLLVITGPGTSGRQAEIQGWIAQLQSKLGSATDRPGQGRRTCQVQLEGGQPRLASADRSEEALAAYLVRVGALSRDRLARAMGAHRGLGPVAAAVAAGEMLPLQLSRQLSSFVQWSVLGSFGWRGGSYAFWRGAECVEGFPTTYRGLELIARGVSHLEEPFVDRHLERLAGRKLKVVPNDAVRLEDLAGPPVTEVHQSLASPRTPAQVIQACPDLAARRIKQALYLLLECGLVRQL